MTKATYDKLVFSLLAVAVNVLVVALVWVAGPVSYFKPHTVSADVPIALSSQLPKNIISGKPVRITLTDPAVDLPVVDGSFDRSTGQWTLGNFKAFYATPSVRANTYGGNTLIYAHDNHTAFINLHLVQPGAELLVYTDNGYVFHYTYQSSQQVDPNDLSVFTIAGPPRVTLQTCSGDWYQYRQMFLFTFKSVGKQ